MQKQARVVIVGGGVSGLSALYHLTLEGWIDVVLLERDELTSGTTWHSAAQCPVTGLTQKPNNEWIVRTDKGDIAIESMRLEKGYGHWKADLITEFNPIEAGLQRFVDLNKDFLGKAGLQAQLTNGQRKTRVLLDIDSTHAPAQPGEGVFHQGKAVGAITSAAWGYRTGKNLAMAYIDSEFADDAIQLEVLLLGKLVPATTCALCLFNPDNKLPRGINSD